MACVQYLQNWLIFFYATKPDIVQRAKNVAKSLGGELEVPRLGWKYAWIKAIFGWGLAKRAQVFFPAVRWAIARFLDKAAFLIESDKVAGLAGE